MAEQESLLVAWPLIADASVSLILATLVAILFWTIYRLLRPILGWDANSRLKHRLGWFGQAFSAILRFSSCFVGLCWNNKVLRWSHLVSSILLLAFGAAVLPKPIPYILIGVWFSGLVITYAAWLSEPVDDTDYKAELDGYNIPTGEDFINESVFYFISLFFFFPLLLGMADSGGDLFKFGDEPWNKIIPYTGYTWGEFLKAMPFIDWSEPYGVGNLLGGNAISLWGQHLTFLFRLTFDLIILAGVIKMISISSQVARGRYFNAIDRMLNTNKESAVSRAVTQLKNRVGHPDLSTAYAAAARMISSLQLEPLTIGSRRQLAAGLYAFGKHRGEQSALMYSLDTYQTVLASLDLQTAANDWAQTQRDLGLVSIDLGRIRGARRFYDRAIEHYRKALNVWTRTSEPSNWAGLNNSIGLAFTDLGQLTGEEQMFETAIGYYNSALQVWTRQDDEWRWATAQDNMGLAQCYWGLARRSSALFEEAVASFDRALEVRKREREIESWAKSRNNLGYALVCLGALNEENATIEKAISALAPAGEAFLDIQMPRYWSIVQTNIGVGQWLIGRNKKSAVRLAAAADTFRMVLRRISKAQAPRMWAEMSAFLGGCLVDQFGVAPERIKLEKAISALEDALEHLSDLGRSEEIEAVEADTVRAKLILTRYEAGEEYVELIDISEPSVLSALWW